MKKKILLTGAGGRLGSYLREPLSNICNTLISTDIKKDIGKLNENEKYFSADLSNFDQICDSEYRPLDIKKKFISSMVYVVTFAQDVNIHLDPFSDS